jgi:aromatic ring hydroxylase
MTVDGMDAVAAADQPTPTRPLTGAEYLESLRDGREIWLYSERVADVTTHPAFRNTARMIARLGSWQAVKVTFERDRHVDAQSHRKDRQSRKRWRVTGSK